MPKNKVVIYIIKSIQERIKIILVYLKFGQKISFNQDIKDSFLISFGDFPEDILPIPILFETFSESVKNVISDSSFYFFKLDI